MTAKNVFRQGGGGRARWGDAGPTGARRAPSGAAGEFFFNTVTLYINLIVTAGGQVVRGSNLLLTKSGGACGHRRTAPHIIIV